MKNNYPIKRYQKSISSFKEKVQSHFFTTTRYLSVALLMAMTPAVHAQVNQIVSQAADGPCAAVNVPYTLPLASVTQPDLPECVIMENLNGDNSFWASSASTPGITGPVMRYGYSLTLSADDWFYTRKLNLTAGISYRLNFKTRSAGFEEKLKVAVGSLPTATSMTQTLMDITIPTGMSAAQSQVVDFTVATTGVYNLGFQAHSDADQNALYVGEVSLSNTPTCLVPSALIADTASITQTGYTFSWTASSSAPANGYEFEVRTSGAAGSGATGLAASGTTAAGITTATATGLSAGTIYTTYVRAVCSASDSSTWIQSELVSTGCAPVNIPYNLPLASATVPDLPICVSIENLNNDNKLWKTATSTTGITGKVMQYAYSTTLAADDWFYTAALNLTAGTSYRLSYKYRASGFEEKLKVAVGTAATAGSMTQILTDTTIPASQSAATLVITDFTVPTTGVYNIGFQAHSAANMNSIYIGEMSVTLGPTCLPPTGIIVTNLDKNSATIAWTEPDVIPSNGYSYEIRTSGAAGSGATGLFLAGTTAVGIVTADIIGLTPSTEYSIYVFGNCGTVNQSLWTSAVMFSTLCDYLVIEAINDTTCVGSTAILQVSGATTEVTWYATDTSLEVLETGPLFETPELLQTTSYWAQATTGSGASLCMAPSRTEVIATVNEIPVITGNNVQTVTVDAFEDATLADLEPLGGNINWFPTEADAIAFTNELEIGTQLNSGTTYYAVLTEDDCRSLPFAVLVTVALGIENNAMTALLYYPNPVQDQLHITYSANITAVVVYNLVGQKVMTITPNATNVTLDMSRLSAGTYMIQVNADTASKVIKVVRN